MKRAILTKNEETIRFLKNLRFRPYSRRYESPSDLTTVVLFVS
jgi:hypothetical protein